MKYTVRFKRHIDDDYTVIVSFSLSRVIDLFRNSLIHTDVNSSVYFIVDCSLK